MASWTFNEPWPNAAHGCVVDYYGLPKMGYYWVREALATIDVSLAYSNVRAVAGQRLNATVWIDTERAAESVAVKAEYIDPHTGQSVGDPETWTAETSPAAPVGLGRLKLSPAASLIGGVLLVRLTASPTMVGNDGGDGTVQDYFFGITAAAGATGGGYGVGGPLSPLLTTPPVALSLSVAANGTILVTAAVGGACALFVKPTLRDSDGAQVGYVTFSRGFFTLLPGQSASLEPTSAPLPSNAVSACVEAWRSPRRCVEWRGGSRIRLEV